MTTDIKENNPKLKKGKKLKRPLEDAGDRPAPKKVKVADSKLPKTKGKKLKRPLENAEDRPAPKKKLKQKKSSREEPEEEVRPVVPLTRRSDDPAPAPKVKWINKQRVLIFCSHGIKHQQLALMKNFRVLLPHSKAEPKMDKKDPLFEINGICEGRNCNKCIYFEQKRNDLYLWVSNVPNGPSAKFLVENIKSMDDLSLTGNCLRGGQRFVGFNEMFENEKHLEVLKELLTQTFQTPRGHPYSKPFLDHTFVFNADSDDRIVFRNYQIVENGSNLEEIGPRMTLNLIKIFEGSFSGKTLYANLRYTTPAAQRRLQRLQQKQEEEGSSDED